MRNHIYVYVHDQSIPVNTHRGSCTERILAHEHNSTCMHAWYACMILLYTCVLLLRRYVHAWYSPIHSFMYVIYCCTYMIELYMYMLYCSTSILLLHRHMHVIALYSYIATRMLTCSVCMYPHVRHIAPCTGTCMQLMHATALCLQWSSLLPLPSPPLFRCPSSWLALSWVAAGTPVYLILASPLYQLYVCICKYVRIYV